MYSLDEVLKVRKMYYEMGMGVTEISRETGISRPTIYGMLGVEDFNAQEAENPKGNIKADLKNVRDPQTEAGSPSEAGTEKASDGTAADPPPSVTETGGNALVPEEGPGKRKGRTSKLDPFKPFIIQCLLSDKKESRKQRFTNKRILKLIQEKGYDGGRTIFYQYMKELRKELKVSSKKAGTEGSIPLYHYPGEAQADFGKARFEEDGLSYSGSFFVLSFPHSNAGFLQQHFGESLEAVLESLKAIFEHIGGVPREIWFDNAAAIVMKILDEGRREVAERFSRFQAHYRFKAVFMNPDSPQEKGNVERKVSYLRHNVLVPVPKFERLDAFNKDVFRSCEELIREDVHYKYKVPVSALFDADKEALLPLPSVPFDTARYEVVHTDNYGFFKLQNGHHFYSSAPDLSNSDLLVKITAANVEVMTTDGSRHVVIHPRLYGGGKDTMECINYVPYLKYIARKPRSFFNTPIREMMPAGLVSYIDSLPNGERGRILSELDILASSEGFGRAVDILFDRLEGMSASGRRDPSEGSHSERLDIPYALTRDPADKENDIWP